MSKPDLIAENCSQHGLTRSLTLIMNGYCQYYKIKTEFYGILLRVYSSM